jgi:hypothetical protein
MAENNGPGDCIDWDSGPPKEDGVFYDILQPRKNGKLTLFVINHQLVQATTHYYGKRTRPHLKDPKLCEGCKLQMKLRWDGYFGCFDPGSGRIVISHLTTNAARNCPQVLDQTKDCRGAMLVTWRRGDQDRSPMLASIDYRTPTKNLPEPINVRRVLENVWGFHQDREPAPGQRSKDNPSGLCDFDENGELRYDLR